MTWRVLTEDGRERYASRIMENATMAAIAWSDGNPPGKLDELTRSLNNGDVLAAGGLTCHATMVSDTTGEWFGFECGRMVAEGSQ